MSCPNWNHFRCTRHDILKVPAICRNSQLSSHSLRGQDRPDLSQSNVFCTKFWNLGHAVCVNCIPLHRPEDSRLPHYLTNIILQRSSYWQQVPEIERTLRNTQPLEPLNLLSNSIRSSSLQVASCTWWGKLCIMARLFLDKARVCKIFHFIGNKFLQKEFLKSLDRQVPCVSGQVSPRRMQPTCALVVAG